jgi:hypothetical protein
MTEPTESTEPNQPPKRPSLLDRLLGLLGLQRVPVETLPGLEVSASDWAAFEAAGGTKPKDLDEPAPD